MLVAIDVDSDGFREVLGISEGAKEDKAGWSSFLRYLKKRGLKATKLFISDACLGLTESLADFYPEAKWQRCTVHFCGNVFSVVPSGKVRQAATMLKAMKLSATARKVEEAVEETLTYYDFPVAHWLRIRANNPLEPLDERDQKANQSRRLIPRCHLALMLSAARLRHVAGTKWGTMRYLTMELLKQPMEKELEVA